MIKKTSFFSQNRWQTAFLGLHSAAVVVTIWAFLAVPISLARNSVPQFADLSKVKIFLHTVDVGEPLYAKFGHTAIRVLDEDLGYDRIFNLGMFDDSDPMFAWNFYKGIMIYTASEYSMMAAMRGYQYEQRRVVEDLLPFTPQEAEIFLEKLRVQMAPENRAYHYDYFFDNCSTRFRDFINASFDNEFRNFVNARPDRETFRSTVRTHMANFAYIQLSLDILMNGNLDRPMSPWEEMYLPARFQWYLKEFLSQKLGRKIPSEVLVEGKRPSQPLVLSIYLIVMLVFGSFFLMLASAVHLGKLLLQQRTLGSALLLWGLWSSVYGLVMTANWLISDHIDLLHNVNLLIFFPLDVVLVRRGWQLLRGQSCTFKVQKILSYYLSGRVVLALAAFCGQKMGLIDQDIAPIYLSFGVGFTMLAVFYGLTYRMQLVRQTLKSTIVGV
jgi:hypothetical protein